VKRATGAAIGTAALVVALGANGSTVRGVPRGFSAVSLGAADTDHLWLAGTMPCGSEWCSVIIRSSDGGRHFERVAAPPFPGQGDAPQLVFADRHDGFAALYGRPLYATHDGGTSWQRTSVHALALVSSAGRAYATSGRRLLSTQAVGGVWHATHLSFDPVDVAAFGRDVWVLGAVGNSEKLAHSRDSGRSFVTGTGLCFPGLGGRLLPVSSRVVWAYCPTGMLGGAWRSINGGATFKPLRAPPHCCINSAAIAPASADVAVLSSLRGLFRTTDGGATWQRARAPSNASYEPIEFVNSHNGFALAIGAQPSRLWQTTDAGATWHAVPIR
jgi:photosystem II stability/assembly factor-like uncharacterized protein